MFPVSRRIFTASKTFFKLLPTLAHRKPLERLRYRMQIMAIKVGMLKRVACATWNLKFDLFFWRRGEVKRRKIVIKAWKGNQMSCWKCREKPSDNPWQWHGFKLCGRRILELAGKGTRYWLQKMWKPFAVVKLLPQNHLSARKLFTRPRPKAGAES